MSGHELLPSIESLSSIGLNEIDDGELWLMAVLFFGLGDIVTTSLGLWLPGVIETHPIAAYVFQQSGVGALVVLKVIVFAGCYILWRVTPEPQSVGVPLGLVFLGVFITLWNLVILLLAFL